MGMDTGRHGGRLQSSTPARQVALVRLLQAVVQAVRSRTSLALPFLAGAVLASLLKRAYAVWCRVRKMEAEFQWRHHHDFSVLQACILSTEHLESLGRVEKRTLFLKPIKEIFRNEQVRARLLAAAEKAAASKDPIMTTKLSAEDKWYVLNTCTNYISSFFAPYHIFFNEARRVKSYYRSAWYCFTLTCAQTESAGRWFITPLKPVGSASDCGALRIRIVLMNEQELRDIANKTIEAPAGMFNGRHESRWAVCQRFAELFTRQLTKVSGGASEDPLPEAWDLVGQRWEDWGSVGQLCKTLGRRVASRVGLAGMEEEQQVPLEPRSDPEENAILRIHIPFPSSANRDWQRGSTKEGTQDVEIME